MTLASTLFSSESVSMVAAATDVLKAGLADLTREVNRLALLPVQFKKGNFFEFILAAKFNADAAAQGSSLRAAVTAALGHTTAPADILVFDGQKLLACAQAKVSNSSTYLSRVLSNAKYQGMLKLVPSDKAARVQKISAGLASRVAERGDPQAVQYADTAVRVQGELRVGSVGSGQTDHDEALLAAQNPGQYIADLSAGAIVREVLAIGTNAAVSSGIVAGALSYVQMWLDAQRGGAITDPVGRIANDASHAAARSGATAMLATGIRHSSWFSSVAQPRTANAVASFLVESGVGALAYIRGQISGEELMHRLGQNGCSTLSGMYGATALGAALGPSGVLLGSMVGYLISSNLYHSCLAIIWRARLAEEEAVRAVKLCEEALQQLTVRRKLFEDAWQVQFAAREDLFRRALQSIEFGISADDPEVALQGMSSIAGICGLALRFPDFQSFDTFMCNTDEPIPL